MATTSDLGQISGVSWRRNQEITQLSGRNLEDKEEIN